MFSLTTLLLMESQPWELVLSHHHPLRSHADGNSNPHRSLSTLALDRKLLFLAWVLSINVNSFAPWDLQTLPRGSVLALGSPVIQIRQYGNCAERGNSP